MENPYSQLKKDNQKAFKEMFLEDRRIVLLTEGEDSKIAIYEPSGKLIRLIDMKTLRIIDPMDSKLSPDGNTFYYVKDAGDLMALDLHKPESEPKVVRAATNNTGEQFQFLTYGKSVLVKDKSSANLDKITAQSDGTYIKETCSPVPEGKLEEKNLRKSVSMYNVDNNHILFDIDGKYTTIVSHKDWKFYGAGNNSKHGGGLMQFSAVNQKGNLQKIMFEEKKGLLVTTDDSNLIVWTGNDSTGKWACKQSSITKYNKQGKFVKLCHRDGKIIVATPSHYLVYNLTQENEPSLIVALQFKFSIDHPDALVFLNVDNPSDVVLVKGKKAEFTHIDPFWENMVPVPIEDSNEGQHSKNDHRGDQRGDQRGNHNPSGSQEKHAQGAYGSDEDDGGYGDEEDEAEQPEGKKTTKGKKKKRVVKQRKRSFDLHGMHNMKESKYNALRDEHLKSYFYSYRIRDHLIKQHLVGFDLLDNSRWVHY